MKEKLKAWLIHKLGGFTRAEFEKNDAERQKQIDAWTIRYNELVNEYGRIETISARKTIDAFALREYEPKICADMMNELYDQLCRHAGRFVEKYFCDDYERNRRTVTMSIRLVRNDRYLSGW